MSSLALALPHLVRADGRELRLDPALLLGAGGEARVFAVPGDAGRVAKVYHRPTEAHARKIARMIADPPVLGAGDGVRLAWPEEVLSDGAGRVAGFVMPRAEGPRIFEFYNPVTRRAQAPLFHYGLLHRAGAHLAAAFAALHARGYVVGDVNESNILVASDGRVSLVDTDSFQVPDAAAVLRSGVGRPEFTPPELQGVAFADVDRAPEHDLFGLGVLIFLLLMEGTHPFAVRVESGAEPIPLEERIRAGMFPHAGDRGCAPPRLAPAFGILHPLVRELFVRCFVDGHADPSARPTATQWRAVLAKAELELTRCGENAQHRHARHLDDCPWCERAAILRGRDPFPVTADAAKKRAPAPGPPVLQWPPKPARPAVGSVTVPPFIAHRLDILRDAITDPVSWVVPLLLLSTITGGWLGGVLFLVMLMVGTVTLMNPRDRPQRRFVVAMMTVSLVILILNGTFAERSGVSDGDASPSTETRPGPVIGWRAVLDPEIELTVVDEPPRLLNPAEVADIEGRHFPRNLPGMPYKRVRIRFWVEADGSTDMSTARVVYTDGDAYTQAARVVARVARFSPARKNGQPIAVQVEMDVPSLSEARVP